MQGTQLLLQDLPTHLRQETDTAHPQPLIPIYYIHDGPRPFCTDPACFCARSKQDATRLFGDIAQGSFFLLEAANLLDTGSNTTSTNQLRKTFVTIHIVEGIPEECQLYGHSWEQTAEHPDVKECTLCQVRGYCPRVYTDPASKRAGVHMQGAWQQRAGGAMTYYQDEAITTASPPKLYQVKLRSGRTWTGTKRQLMETNPSW